MTSPVLLNRYSQDVGLDTRMLARYIGNLEEGRSKVSVNTSMPVGDTADHFRFRLATSQMVRFQSGELVGEAGRGIEVAEDGSVRYQLLSASGRVLADSNPESGEAYESWVAFTGDENLELGRGAYTLRVSRGPESINNEEYVYSFTLRSGVDPITADSAELASREFLTTERMAPAGATFDAYANVTAVLGLFADVRVI